MPTTTRVICCAACWLTFQFASALRLLSEKHDHPSYNDMIWHGCLSKRIITAGKVGQRRLTSTRGWGYTVCGSVYVSPTFADVAQWQSNGFVNHRSSVQIRPSAPSQRQN